MPINSGLRAGATASLPVLLVIAPFGAIFGAVASQAGLSLLEAFAMTTIILAGAAQFASLQLLVDQAPAIVAILTGLFINLRFAMYSASIAPYWEGAPLWKRALGAYLMTDQAYGISIRRFLENPEESRELRISYYFGVAVPTVIVWFVSTGMGSVLGAAIPPQLTLEFAVPVTFIAIVAPILRDLPSLTAATTAVVIALISHSLPYNLGLLVAAVSGMLVGLAMELFLESRNGVKQP